MEKHTAFLVRFLLLTTALSFALCFLVLRALDRPLSLGEITSLCFAAMALIGITKHTQVQEVLIAIATSAGEEQEQFIKNLSPSSFWLLIGCMWGLAYILTIILLV